MRYQGYKAYVRRGAHDVKQKTTTGTPDTFFLMPNGLYLFVESTTTKHEGKGLLDKLKNDISACLNTEKTGVPINKIQEIILCYNSKIKKPVELEYVNSEANKIMGKLPIHYNLDSLAHEIYYHHKNLAHDYLGLRIDSGQIISLTKFVEEYDNGKQKLATPLAGAFYHRSQELEDIHSKLIADDIVIISGPAGVGKSKLALEAINKFLQSHLNYNSYAISQKGADLLGDLEVYFSGTENGILLVDDVNRVDKFEQILGFYRGLDRGKLKLILTVRDYALENIITWLSAYKNSIVEIQGFTSEEINTIIEQKPYGIKNWKYQHKINTIAKGNARLAVILAKITKEKNTLDSLNNVSELFEQYFETFVSDEHTFKDKNVLKALGILSFFYRLPYNDGELLDSVANSFFITSDELRNAFDVLHNLDLIEINYEHVKIGEQNFSTYFFYKIFIKDKVLSFESLWNNYFELQQHRFEDTVYPMYENFGKEFIAQEIRPVLLSYWSNILVDEEKAFLFLNFAWEFLPDQCINYLESRIDIYEISDVVELKTDYEMNDFVSTSRQEKHLKLLSNFLKQQTTLLDALDLSFRFTEFAPEHLPELIYYIDESFNFIDEDYSNHFTRQITLVDYLIDQVNKGDLQAFAFFAVSLKLLSRLRWTYKNPNEAEKDDLNLISVKLIRGKILDALCKLYTTYPDRVLNVMLDFSIAYQKDNKFVMEYDLIYLIPWINNNLDKNNFHHCYYVQEMIRSSIKGGYNHYEFKRLESFFLHPTYSVFELVLWNRRRGKEVYEFDNYQEYDVLKKADIAKNLIFESESEVKQFISRYSEILKWGQIKIHSQYFVIESIIEANLKSNIDIGFLIFVELAKLQDQEVFESRGFISWYAMDVFTTYSDLADRFWEVIDFQNLNEKWRIEVLSSIPEDAVTLKHLSRLYTVLNEVKINCNIPFQRLKKYVKFDQNVLHKALQTVVNKIEDENLRISFWEEFFIESGHLIKDTNLLKKAYIQQDVFDDNFDYEGKALLVILQRDSSFLLEYIKTIFEKELYGRARDHKELTVVWSMPHVEVLLDEIIEYMASNDNHYLLLEHFANAFFYQMTDHVKRGDKYLLYLIQKYSDQPKIIYIVFDIIHNSRKALFEEAFVAYIQRNQDVECFKKIEWTDTQTLFSGNASIGGIRAAKWEKLLRLVENAGLGIKVRAIRSYIKERRDCYLQNAENEKRRRFLTGF